MTSPADSSPRERLIRLTRQHLESLLAAGVQQLPHVQAADSAPQRAAEDRPASQAKPEGVAAAANLLDACDQSSAPTLEVLASEVAECTLCDELASTRTQTVFGVGNPQARLCFLGEAPGADEDRLGEPFVGRSGQLLTKILAACGLSRGDVYILNILKCRPPENRNPTGGESTNCRRFLNRQLELIAPEFICCLGTVAAQNLLDTNTSIGRLRGRLHDYRGIHVVCTYHPAYLLRTPAAKRDAWNDMKFLMEEMGTPVVE